MHGHLWPTSVALSRLTDTVGVPVYPRSVRFTVTEGISPPYTNRIPLLYQREALSPALVMVRPRSAKMDGGAH